MLIAWIPMNIPNIQWNIWFLNKTETLGRDSFGDGPGILN